MSSPSILDPLTRLQCCPPTCGAAAAIVCTEEFADSMGTIKVSDSCTIDATDFDSSFQESLISMVGFDMAKAAATDVYERSGISPSNH